MCPRATATDNPEPGLKDTQEEARGTSLPHSQPLPAAPAHPKAGFWGEEGQGAAASPAMGSHTHPSESSHHRDTEAGAGV